MMDLPLTDEQAALLLAELDRIIDDDRYPLSPRVRALRMEIVKRRDDTKGFVVLPRRVLLERRTVSV